MALVHQPSLERVGSELGTADDDVTSRLRLYLSDRIGIARALPSSCSALTGSWLG
jgi:hypothetical protein